MKQWLGWQRDGRRNLLRVGTMPSLCSLMRAHGRGVINRGGRDGFAARQKGLEVWSSSFGTARPGAHGGAAAARAGTWEVSGCPSRSQRTAGRGLPAAAQLQRRSDPMSASVSVITFSHSG